MKRMALLSAAALLLALLLGGCGSANAAEPTPSPTPTEAPRATAAPWEELMGGWRATDSLDLPEEAKEAFDQVMTGLVGVRYTPEACLGTQVVAGTNYCILCRAEQVVPNAVPYYVLVYIYRDLKGGAQMLGIEPLHIGVPAE